MRGAERAEARRELTKARPASRFPASDLGEVAEPVFVQERRLQSHAALAVNRAKKIEDLARGHGAPQHGALRKGEVALE